MKHTVAVRALCEFTAKAGDLDLRFTPSPTSQEGIAGHAAVAARRAGDYRREVKLAGCYRELEIRGRADGYDPTANTIEEIKTYRGDIDAIPQNHRALHRAQARMYGWLLCEELGLPGINVAVVYFDVDLERETSFAEYLDSDRLRRSCEAQCEQFLAWARQELTHRTARDGALHTLRFVHDQFRRGQRELAEAVYKTACTGRALLAQAPTGIGKTLGALFPALKALPARQLDKVFFLTAKTTGRTLALEALAQLRTRDPTLPLRFLELTARDKSCEHPDKACHGESCPLACGFYDRLPAARADAATRATLDQQTVRVIATRHAICPYYLAQEMVRWSDVVIGDYNYFFDASALLFNLVRANDWRATVLVDEAHSLVDRARAMYSAELDQGDLAAMRRDLPVLLKKPLDRLQRQWCALTAAQAADYQLHEELPAGFVDALHKALVVIGEFAADKPLNQWPALQDFYFRALQFGRLIETFDDHSMLDSSRYRLGARDRTKLCVRNIVPAPFLEERFEASHGVVLFSATLNPRTYYQKLLGLPEQTAWIDVVSPFDGAQLTVHIATISTRFRDRMASVEPTVDLIARQFRDRPGNYLAFFNSFDHLQQVATRLQQSHSAIPIWSQQRHMDEPARADFVGRFRSSGAGIGFAVLGGAFGEGIDLPGDRLIGAFVATLGLPQVNPVNEEIMRRTAALFGAEFAYDYSYLIPGMRKVAQAGGRIIRTPRDKGVLFLIDDRFLQRRVQELLPKWWELPAKAGRNAQRPCLGTEVS